MTCRNAMGVAPEFLQQKVQQVISKPLIGFSTQPPVEPTTYYFT